MRAELLAALREETGCATLGYAEPPEQIPSGHESDVYALALRGEPPGFDGPLIARCFGARSPPRAASLEAAIHEGLRAQDFPAPRVLSARDADPAFLLMERLPGRALGDGAELEEGLRERLAGLLALLKLSLGLPARLGEVTRRLLALDPEPVLAGLEARGLPRTSLRFDRLLERAERRVRDGGHRGCEAGLHWLRAARPAEPPPERQAICHGDLAPNLLVEDGRVTGVIDWSSASVTVGDPAFEVGNSQAMIQIPLPLPGPLARASRAYQLWLVDRFVRSLGPELVPPPDRVRYYAASRWFRTLLNAAELWQACAAGAPFPERPDPWCVPEVALQVAAGFHSLTGVAVELPAPPRVH